MDDIISMGAGATYTTILDGLELLVSIGIHAAERAAPQRIRLTVQLHAAYPETPEDRIDAVVDYDFLRAGIHALVRGRHFELQETLCDDVARLALADSRVVAVRVRSMKPDVYPDAAVGCEILRRR
jgi:7,8-dihydroneopterin aldolase/epimerase/oxygenase